jgi:hypothetical protein
MTPLERKKIRKAIFKEMLNDSKTMEALLPVYKVVWLMEERGLRKTIAQRLARVNHSTCGRHIFNLYRLRRGMLIELGSEKYFGFGKPLKFTKGKTP